MDFKNKKRENIDISKFPRFPFGGDNQIRITYKSSKIDVFKTLYSLKYSKGTVMF